MPPVLVVFGGLPATGKSTVATLLARRMRSPYLRVDRIEQAIVGWSALVHPVGPVGYAVAYELAGEQLSLGLDVIVECVNPIAVTRDAWVSTGESAGAGTVEVELVCSDSLAHRRRVATRVSDVEGLVKPDWRKSVECNMTRGTVRTWLSTPQTRQLVTRSSGSLPRLPPDEAHQAADAAPDPPATPTEARPPQIRATMARDDPRRDRRASAHESTPAGPLCTPTSTTSGPSSTPPAPSTRSSTPSNTPWPIPRASRNAAGWVRQRCRLRHGFRYEARRRVAMSRPPCR